MPNYQVKDIEWVRGGTQPMAFNFRRKTGSNPDTFEGLVFDDCRFSVWSGAEKGGKLLFRYSIVGGEITLSDPANGGVQWKVQPADTRACTFSTVDGEAKNRYEIELRSGIDERIYIMGKVKAVGGVNDDEADEGIS